MASAPDRAFPTRLINRAHADACAREPIHTPGAIQPYGHLLAFRGLDLVLARASANAAEILAKPLPDAFGGTLEQVLAVEPTEAIRQALSGRGEGAPVQLGAVRSRRTGSEFHPIAHRSPDGFAILELETRRAEDPGRTASLEHLYPLISAGLEAIGAARSLDEIASAAAREVRRLTGFDRALVYRFEPNWDGVVIAEDRNDRLPSYLGLRFPAADIPAQARLLYETNRLRLIADVDYTPVPILPGGGAALDLSHAAFRGVSPVHLHYMRNMGTPASMSISLLRGDRLWGLISCHHADMRHVPFAVRAACDLFGQMLSSRVAAEEDTARAQARANLAAISRRLLARMAAAPGKIGESLAGIPAELCALTGAEGAAVITTAGCTLVGETPAEADIREIAAWLHRQGVEEVFETHALASSWPAAERFSEAATGLLAASISRLHPSFVFWFRPEVIRTVSWGGDPRKSAATATGLSPRHSFDTWKETVRGTAVPWRPEEIGAARDLRSAIVGVVLQQAEERAELTSRLERINGELAAFSHSVSHDLRAPFRHIVGYAELLLEREGERLDEKSRRFVATIIESAETAGLLVDALLNFSRMGRASLTPVEIETNALVREVVRTLDLEVGQRRVEWRIATLPNVRADPVMLRQVFQNLLSNAAKYTRGRDEAVIEVTAETHAAQVVFSVRDNGIGFDMAYAHKLFGVFQRLHRAEDYEGVGIGLANVRRIVERHGGRAWAEGASDRGATFHFSLPVMTPNRRMADDAE